MLFGPKGDPIESSSFASSKGDKPLLGEIVTSWAGTARMPVRLPHQNLLQIDTSKLSLNDLRLMLNHYQINSSLTVLTFMLHQIEWWIECDDVKLQKQCDENMREIWTRLIRALSQAFWAGFAPCALQWENDVDGKRVKLTKVKDLRPEECRPHWKQIEGVSSKKVSTADGNVISSIGTPQVPQKVKIFDGIDQVGLPVIPVSNALWYPLLMREGDYFGRKLLHAAYQPWYFSNLIHYYSNRYFERFGEPVIVARAPFNEKINVNGQSIQGNLLMNTAIGMVRSGAGITLPNDRAMNGLDGAQNYEYMLEYLESQMRGADFERYLTRLDQEISLALFTPLLMMNTGDGGGSFNLGIVHTNMYDNMVAAVGGDLQEYINKYVLAPMCRFNRPGQKAPKLATWHFRKPGKVKEETLRTIILSLLSNGNDGKHVKIDLTQVGQELGIDLEATQTLVNPPKPEPQGDSPDGPGGSTGEAGDRGPRAKRPGAGKGTQKPAPTNARRDEIANKVAHRIAGQFIKQIKDGVDQPVFDIGHEVQLGEVVETDRVEWLCGQINNWASEYYKMEFASESPLESEIRDNLLNTMKDQLENA